MAVYQLLTDTSSDGIGQSRRRCHLILIHCSHLDIRNAERHTSTCHHKQNVIVYFLWACFCELHTYLI